MDLLDSHTHTKKFPQLNLICKCLNSSLQHKVKVFLAQKHHICVYVHELVVSVWNCESVCLHWNGNCLASVWHSSPSLCSSAITAGERELNVHRNRSRIQSRLRCCGRCVEQRGLWVGMRWCAYDTLLAIFKVPLLCSFRYYLLFCVI